MRSSVIYVSQFLLVLLLFCPPTLEGLTGGNLYRVMMNEEGRPHRLVFVRALKETQPEAFLLDSLTYQNPVLVQSDNSSIIYDQKSYGQVPTLCFHRIGEDDLYELSLPRVHHLFAMLQKNSFFPISDLEYSRGDFQNIPSGMKPVVLGADDAGATQLLWDEQTLGAYQSDKAFTEPILDPNCLAAIFSRYFTPVQGRYNLTFYVSFDAIPFRQLGGLRNPGFPYEGVSLIGDKLAYAQDHYFLGYHGLTHTFREKQTTEELFHEIEESSRILSDYLGQNINLPTMAYPYGSGRFTPDEERLLVQGIQEGRFPAFAFDLNGQFAPLPWSRGFKSWDIPRFSVENQSFELLLDKLDSPSLYTSKRTLLIHSDKKNFDLNDFELNLGGDDIVYVYIP